MTDMTDKTDVEMVYRDQDREEWNRRWGQFVNQCPEVYDEMEQENELVSAPIHGQHGPLFSIRHTEYCTCYVGASCDGRGYSVARSDCDGPYGDLAELYAYTALDPYMLDEDNEKIIAEWIRLGRPRQHWERWWLHAEEDSYFVDQFSEHARHSEAAWDEMRLHQRAEGITTAAER